MKKWAIFPISLRIFMQICIFIQLEKLNLSKDSLLILVKIVSRSRYYNKEFTFSRLIWDIYTIMSINLSWCYLRYIKLKLLKEIKANKCRKISDKCSCIFLQIIERCVLDTYFVYVVQINHDRIRKLNTNTAHPMTAFHVSSANKLGDQLCLFFFFLNYN